MDTMEVEILKIVGPVGIALLLGWVAYLKYSKDSGNPDEEKLDETVQELFTRYHEENTRRLDGIQDSLDGCLHQLRDLNARQERSEQWQHANDKQDDERYVRNQDEHGHLRRDTDILREGVHTLRNEVTAAAARALLAGRRDPSP